MPSDDLQQFKDLANAIPNLAWIADATGYIFWYNERWYEYTGTTPEQMKGWGWQSVHSPDILPDVMERWTESIRKGQPFEMIFPLRAKDGQYRSFLTRIVPILDAKGKVVRWFGTNTDVDELRRTQEALRQREQQLRFQQERLRFLRAVARIVPWEYYVQADRFEWSDEVLELFGTLPGNSKEQFLSLMKFSSDREYADQSMKLALTRKREFEFRFRISDPSGEARLIMARGKPFYNHGDDLILGMFVDVTPPVEISSRPRIVRSKASGEKGRRR